MDLLRPEGVKSNTIKVSRLRRVLNIMLEKCDAHTLSKFFHHDRAGKATNRVGSCLSLITPQPEVYGDGRSPRRDPEGAITNAECCSIYHLIDNGRRDFGLSCVQPVLAASPSGKLLRTCLVSSELSSSIISKYG